MTIDLPQELEERARAKVAAGEYNSVADVVRAGLEALELLEDEDREGQHSVRINDQYRICFEWTKDGPAAVEVVDYH